MSDALSYHRSSLVEVLEYVSTSADNTIRKINNEQLDDIVADPKLMATAEIVASAMAELRAVTRNLMAQADTTIYVEKI